MFMSKVSGFVVTFAEWYPMGCPRREPEWVAEIFDTHCSNCEHYAADDRTVLMSRGLCRLCGCHVGREPDLLNKITLPNTQCPADPPKWVRAVEEDLTPPKP